MRGVCVAACRPIARSNHSPLGSMALPMANLITRKRSVRAKAPQDTPSCRWSGLGKCQRTKPEKAVRVGAGMWQLQAHLFALPTPWAWSVHGPAGGHQEGRVCWIGDLDGAGASCPLGAGRRLVWSLSQNSGTPFRIGLLCQHAAETETQKSAPPLPHPRAPAMDWRAALTQASKEWVHFEM